MKLPLLTILVFLQCFSLLGQDNTKKIEFGIYAVYLDQSTYTQLTINNDGTFKYLNRDFQGVGYTYEGKWKMKKDKLLLVTSQKDNSFRPLARQWNVKDKEVCEILKKNKTGQCLILNADK